MKRFLTFFALMALAAFLAVGCGPGEATMPEEVTKYNDAEKLNENSSTATVSLEDELKESEGK